MNEPITNNILMPEIQNDIRTLISEQSNWNMAAKIFITCKYVAALNGHVFVFTSASSLLSANDKLICVLVGGLLHIVSDICDNLGTYCSTNSNNAYNKKIEVYKSVGINNTEPNINFSDPNIAVTQ